MRRVAATILRLASVPVGVGIGIWTALLILDAQAAYARVAREFVIAGSSSWSRPWRAMAVCLIRRGCGSGFASPCSGGRAATVGRSLQSSLSAIWAVADPAIAAQASSRKATQRNRPVV